MLLPSAHLLFDEKRMSAFIVALLALIATSQGLPCSHQPQLSVATDSACRPQLHCTALCYGAVGKSVFLHLGNVNQSTEIQMRTREKVILKYKNGGLIHCDRSWVFYSGTLRLQRALKNDSEEYFIDVHDSNGKKLWSSQLKLIIQGPLSEPTISLLCLPHGEVRVSCSSDSEDTEYSWTLGSRPLDAGMAYLTEEKDTVILKKNVSGDITCNVRNNINRNSTTVRLPACSASQICAFEIGTEVAVSVRTTEDFHSLLITREGFIAVGGSKAISIACNNTSLTIDRGNEENLNQHADKGAMCVEITILFLAVVAVFTLLLLTAVILCLSRKRKGAEVTDEGENDVQELIYTEVKGFTRAKADEEKEKQQDERVFYGQIQILKAPDHKERRAQGEEDAVYAKLKKKTTNRSR